ncbi:MAG TPA: dipeptide/oligopeptide/nickel ABC transporter ATP-binding protein, partial [Armatimonadetes bacterium]|nr:dipeptide/oligopeptide/nickel ABC transporter ATP-binding protein [Armatimonadota bacterium]
QAQILDLLRRLRAEHNMGLLLITHDLGVVAEMADHVVVMRAGQVLESAPVRQLFGQPEHPYTRALLAAAPRLDRQDQRQTELAGEPTHA